MRQEKEETGWYFKIETKKEKVEKREKEKEEQVWCSKLEDRK